MALRTHLLHDRAYRSLTLVDVVALAPWGAEFFRLVHDNAEVCEQLPAGLHAALVRAYIRGASHRTLPDGEVDELSSPWLGAESQAAFYRQIAQADQRHTDEIEPLYPTLHIATQLIWGAEDPCIPVERAHRLAARIPGSRLTVVEHASHLLQLEAPDELATAVTDVLITHQCPPSVPGSPARPVSRSAPRRCAGPHCNGADRAAHKLAQLGRRVKKMIGGVTGWLDEGCDLVR